MPHYYPWELIADLVNWIANASDADQDRVRLFRQLMKRFDGEPFAGGGDKEPRFEGVRFAIGEVEVAVELYQRIVASEPPWYSRARAQVPMTAAPVFEMRPRSWTTALGIGLGNARFHHAELDRYFVLRTEDSAAVRRAMSKRARDLAVHHLRDCTIASDGSTITVDAGGIWTAPKAMEAAAEMVAELASMDFLGLAALRAVEGSSFRVGEGERPEILVEVPWPVVVGPAPRKGRAVTTARLGPEVELPDLRIRVGSALPDEVSFAPRVHELWPRLEAGTLQVFESQASFFWDTIATKPAHIRLAAELLGALKPTVGGVYR